MHEREKQTDEERMRPNWGEGEKTTPAPAEALLTERRNLADGQPQLLCVAYCAARGSER